MDKNVVELKVREPVLEYLKERKLRQVANKIYNGKKHIYVEYRATKEKVYA